MYTLTISIKTHKLEITCSSLEIFTEFLKVKNFVITSLNDAINDILKEDCTKSSGAAPGENLNKNPENLINSPEIPNKTSSVTFTGSGSGASAKRSRKSTYSKQHFCDQCGQPYTATHNRQLYCTKCKENSKLSKEFGTKRKAVIPNITEKDIMDPMGLTK